MTLLPSACRRLLAALAFSIAALAVSAGAASASVLWTADGERAQSQEWANYSCQDANRVQQVTSPVAQGSHAYSLSVQDGDNSYGRRCELGMGNPWVSGFPLFHAGDDRWISFQVYLPDDYPIETPNWNVFFQIHQPGDMGCPPISLDVEDGQFKLHNSAANTYVLDTVEKWHAPAVRNRWVKFSMHIKFSGDDNTGFVELYGDLDGQGEKQLMQRQYMHTMTDDSNGNPAVEHARIGIYRNPVIQGTSHIFFDGFTIATDQASAEANAFAGPGAATSQPGTLPLPVPPGPAGTPISTPTRAKPRPVRSRVWLRSRTARLRAAASGPWPTVVPVYGGVRPKKGSDQTVIIEIRRGRHWDWLTRGRLRSDGRFYLTAAVDSGSPRRIKLRAVVPGVGSSNVLSARVR